MSGSPPDITELIAEASQLQFAKCVIIAGAGKPSLTLVIMLYMLMNRKALIFYEYALTVSTEMSEIWKSKFSGAQALFFLTRYPYMIFTVLFCINTLAPNQSETLCRVVSYNVTAWIVLPQIGLFGILILRTYAIYQRNQYILVILGLIGMANVAIGLYLGVLEKPEVDSDFGICSQIELPIIPRIQLAANMLSLVLDVLVFTLTFAKTIRHAIEMRKARLGNSLGYFILRDGAMYFLAKLLIGVLATTVFFVPASGTIGNWLTVLVSISNPLTIVLINRLVLNLRQVSRLQDGNTSTLGVISTIQEPAFATNPILGNLGAPLRVGPEEDDEIEETGKDDEAKVIEKCAIVDPSEISEVLRDPLDV